jgi:hypothetical protein
MNHLITTVPVTLTDGIVVHMPVAYSTYTVASTQLAVTPATAPAVSPTGVTDGTAALILGGLIWYAVKHKGHKWGWMVIGIAMGTFMGSGSIGVMIHSTVGQLLASAINSIGGMA